MSEKFSFTLTQQQYLNANKLYFWSSLRSAKSARSLGWLTGLYFIVGMIVMYFEQQLLDAAEIFRIAAIAFAGAFVVLFVCYLVAYLMLPRRTRKLFAQQRLLHLPQNFEITDNAILLESELYNTKVPYDLVFKWAENSAVMAVYHSDQTFQIFPKDIVPASAIDAIRANLIVAGRPGTTL